MKQYKSYERIVSFLAAATKPLVRIQVEGLEHIPKESGAIVILNHISLLDPVLAGVVLKDTRQVRALAKESLFRKPIIGNAMKNMGHIPVLRGSANAKDSLALASLRLREGELVGIYPEGTVPPTIGELGPFKSGAARLALTSKMPVIPVASWGAQEVLPRNEGKLKALLRALFKRPLHKVYIGEAIGPFSGDPENFDQVNEVTEVLRNAVLELLPKVKPEA
jgi:1-acyl-sn-glycerol-3-phosphate acyltransferase